MLAIADGNEATYINETSKNRFVTDAFNMAARSLVLNSSLCFLIDKYGKLTSKSLKSMMLEFYDIAELCGAKMQLLSDVKK